MPWKTKDQIGLRHELVLRMQNGQETVLELSREFGVSRETAYRWKRRFLKGGLAALKDQSHRPKSSPGRTRQIWLARLRRLRLRRPTWGVRKLSHWLGRRFGQRGVPTASTLGRWLKRWGLARGRRRRRVGPMVVRRQPRPAQRCHEVWTVDFKGWYRTGDGKRMDPLTVRDLYSRYGLAIVLMANQEVDSTRREFVKIFRRNGLPERIRCDNGAPFGGGGPTGLTRLSAWWVTLGIEVEFMTPGRPCENGAHEQFHRVYKEEVAKKPARNRAEQQRRSDEWLRQYNQERPHEGLGMKTPVEWYRSNRRRKPVRRGPWKYPAGWIRRWVKASGEINWQGSRRFVGEAFGGNWVGLKAVRAGVWRVYFGPLLVGEMHEEEEGGLRVARHRARR